MKLDYLASGSPDCPIVRLYEFTDEEAGEFHAILAALAAGAVERVDVHELPFVQPIDGCQLVLLRRSWDQSIVRGTAAHFECGLTTGAWDNVMGLVEPFAAGARGYQWLSGAPGDTALLLSRSGDW
jgi:hypothetical protein